MKLFDRYIDQVVSEQQLPNEIDFGRYCHLTEEGNHTDITNSNLVTKKAIHQEILLDKNKSLQDIFIDIAIDTEKAVNNQFSVIPLIRRIKNKLGLNEFEKLLCQKVFHLEEIFRVPHYLLDRVIEKVHVSRAKRIPSKSYQYLASHTEDWIHKSIVSFKPSRILNEELEQNFDIYENQLTIAFIERCLVYLNSRLKEIQDIKSFLSEYEKLLKNRDDQRGWHKKTDRNLTLIGSVYEDDHYHGSTSDGSILTKTEETLSQINKRLQLLRKSDLFDLVNKRVIQAISLRNTNVLVSHKHYRYIKSLWIELDSVKPEKSETEKKDFEQHIINGIRAYCKSLISYVLKENLGYELVGNYNSFKGEHSFLSSIEFKETDKGVFQLIISNQLINIVVIANEPIANELTAELLKTYPTYLFYYAENLITNEQTSVNINPIDPDSAERVGTFFLRHLLLKHLDNINKAYPFRRLLKEYIQYIPNQFIEFNIIDYTYKFHSYPKTKLTFEDVKSKFENDQVIKAKHRLEKENILNAIAELITEINLTAEKLKDAHLRCFHCGELLQSYNIQKLNYLKCKSCNCLIDSSDSTQVIVKIDDPKLHNLSTNEFGMDYLVVNTTYQKKHLK